jgi:hypothetical protein
LKTDEKQEHPLSRWQVAERPDAYGLVSMLEVQGSDNIEKYSSYLKDTTDSRVHRSFAVDCESQVKFEHTVGKMQTILMLQQVTCVAATGDNSPKTTRAV